LEEEGKAVNSLVQVLCWAIVLHFFIAGFLLSIAGVLLTVLLVLQLLFFVRPVRVVSLVIPTKSLIVVLSVSHYFVLLVLFA